MSAVRKEIVVRHGVAAVAAVLWCGVWLALAWGSGDVAVGGETAVTLIGLVGSLALIYAIARLIRGSDRRLTTPARVGLLLVWITGMLLPTGYVKLAKHHVVAAAQQNDRRVTIAELEANAAREDAIWPTRVEGARCGQTYSVVIAVKTRVVAMKRSKTRNVDFSFTRIGDSNVFVEGSCHGDVVRLVWPYRYGKARNSDKLEAALAEKAGLDRTPVLLEWVPTQSDSKNDRDLMGPFAWAFLGSAFGTQLLQLLAKRFRR